MHPAYSVIVFTTLSGAGYGLIVWLSLFAVMGELPTSRAVALLGFGLAFAMITAGLLASTLHLGRPERAWRAFSQWRTSWLSREGVAAVATYVPSGLLAIYWLVRERVDGIAVALAVATVVGALVTVYCTGMIYASLRTIRQWHHPLVPWVFLALALATGAMLLNLILSLLQAPGETAIGVGIASVVAAAMLKLAYWSSVDEAPEAHTIETATGLGRVGSVRPLEPAHTQPNFVMREMGYEIGRRYGRRLRCLAMACALLAPVFLLVAATTSTGAVGVLASLLAVLSAAVGVGVERWLFFAEARHVVTVFYRGGSA